MGKAHSSWDTSDDEESQILKDARFRNAHTSWGDSDDLQITQDQLNLVRSTLKKRANGQEMTKEEEDLLAAIQAEEEPEEDTTMYDLSIPQTSRLIDRNWKNEEDPYARAAYPVQPVKKEEYEETH